VAIGVVAAMTFEVDLSDVCNIFLTLCACKELWGSRTFLAINHTGFSKRMLIDKSFRLFISAISEGSGTIASILQATTTMWR
jgi:hypothetical protein